MKHLVAAAPDQAYTVIVINRVSVALFISYQMIPKVNYQPPPPSRGQVPVWKTPPEPPTTPKRSSNRPPDPAAKKRSQGSKDRGHEPADKGEDHNTIDYRTATHQEVLE